MPCAVRGFSSSCFAEVLTPVLSYRRSDASAMTGMDAGSQTPDVPALPEPGGSAASGSGMKALRQRQDRRPGSHMEPGMTGRSIPPGAKETRQLHRLWEEPAVQAASTPPPFAFRPLPGCIGAQHLEIHATACGMVAAGARLPIEFDLRGPCSDPKFRTHEDSLPVRRTNTERRRSFRKRLHAASRSYAPRQVPKAHSASSSAPAWHAVYPSGQLNRCASPIPPAAHGEGGTSARRSAWTMPPGRPDSQDSLKSDWRPGHAGEVWWCGPLARSRPVARRPRRNSRRLLLLRTRLMTKFVFSVRPGTHAGRRPYCTRGSGALYLPGGGGCHGGTGVAAHHAQGLLMRRSPPAGPSLLGAVSLDSQ